MLALRDIGELRATAASAAPDDRADEDALPAGTADGEPEASSSETGITRSRVAVCRFRARSLGADALQPARSPLAAADDRGLGGLDCERPEIRVASSSLF